eukprot:jgi/Mesvir1/3561/Mv12027-RA.1
MFARRPHQPSRLRATALPAMATLVAAPSAAVPLLAAAPCVPPCSPLVAVSLLIAAMGVILAVVPGCKMRMGTEDLASPTLWRAVLAELFGTAMWVFVAVALGLRLANDPGIASRPLISACATVPLLTLVIYSTIHVSGGILNPLISFTSCLLGFMPVAKASLYIVAQTLGGVIGAYLIYIITGPAAPSHGVLSIAPLTPAVALVSEVVFSFCLIGGIFSVESDPERFKVYGPVLAPALTSMVVALKSFLSAGLVPGYVGACSNPARAFGPAFVTGNLANQWIMWLGPMLAAQMLALAYRLKSSEWAKNGQEASSSQGASSH